MLGRTVLQSGHKFIMSQVAPGYPNLSLQHGVEDILLFFFLVHNELFTSSSCILFIRAGEVSDFLCDIIDNADFD